LFVLFVCLFVCLFFCFERVMKQRDGFKKQWMSLMKFVSWEWETQWNVQFILNIKFSIKILFSRESHFNFQSSTNQIVFLFGRVVHLLSCGFVLWMSSSVLQMHSHFCWSLKSPLKHSINSSIPTRQQSNLMFDTFDPILLWEVVKRGQKIVGNSFKLATTSFMFLR
jgi:hypothetical protein